MSQQESEYWFCLDHDVVEGPDQAVHGDRLGPFPTADEAAHALGTPEENAEPWAEDEAWVDRDLED